MKIEDMLRKEVEQEDERIAQEEGKRFFEERLSPMIAAAAAEDVSARKPFPLKRVLAIVCPVLLIFVFGTLYFTLWNQPETPSYAEWVEHQVDISLEEINEKLPGITVKGNFNEELFWFYDLNSNIDIRFRIQGNLIETKEQVTINIVLEDSEGFSPPNLKNIIESEYLGWPLKYMVQKTELGPFNQFQIQAELLTDTEKVYFDYMQISTEAEPDFVGFLERTIAKK